MPDIRLTCPACWGDGHQEEVEERYDPDVGHREVAARTVRCELCGGDGYVTPAVCPECEDGDVQGICRNCDGAGETRAGTTCARCMGSGVGPMVDCSACEGIGLALQTPKGRTPLPGELVDELNRRQTDPCNICGHAPCRCGGGSEETEVAA